MAETKEWLMDLTLTELVDVIRSKKATPLDSIQACFARVKRLNPSLNALVFTCEKEAIEQAEDQTLRIQRGESVGILAGIPLAVKDLEDASGLPTSYGTPLFSNNVATSDSIQVARLRAHGAIVIGKTNAPIFGTQAFSDNLLFGATRNPWNLQKTPGGSSGGASAVLAARISPLVTAADGGGSIRIPASFVGAFGLKPTFGLVPCDEMKQFRTSKILHCVHYGPLTRSVEDAALILDLVAGYHPCDPFSHPKPERSFQEVLRKERPRGRGKAGAVRMGFSPDLGYVSGCQADIMKAVRGSLGDMRRLGHEVHEDVALALPDLGMSWALLMGAQTYMAVSPAVEGREDQLDPSFVAAWEVLRNLSIDEIGDTMRDLHTLNERLGDYFAEFDVLVTPAMGIDPFDAAGPMTRGVDGKMFDSVIHAVGFCYPFNFSGHPACVVRCGISSAGLPIGVQLVAERHNDALLLQLAKQLQDLTQAFGTWPTAKL